MKPAALDTINRPFSRIRDGLMGGLISGWVFIVAEMIAAMGVGRPTQLPWELAASIARGKGAVGADWTFGLWLTGALVHFGLSVLYGLSWAMIARALVPRVGNGHGAHAALSAGYGLLLWLLNFQLLARVGFPWFLPYNHHPLTQMLLHALTFGLPLGLYMDARLHTLGDIRPAPRRPRLAH